MGNMCGRGAAGEVLEGAGGTAVADVLSTPRPFAETVLALLRNPEYAVYGGTKTAGARDLAAGEAKFNELSLAERGKIKEETLVNYGGKSKQAALGKGAGADPDQELIVVTVLVAARGGLKLPAVNSLNDLKSALNKLGAVPADSVCAVEVLWTPQDPRDSYTQADMVRGLGGWKGGGVGSGWGCGRRGEAPEGLARPSHPPATPLPSPPVDAGLPRAEQFVDGRPRCCTILHCSAARGSSRVCAAACPTRVPTRLRALCFFF